MRWIISTEIGFLDKAQDPCVELEGIVLVGYQDASSLDFRLLERSFSQIASVFQVGLQATSHLHPALAVPVRALQTALCGSPFTLNNLHKGLLGVQRFETHLDNSVVSARFWY